MQQLAIHPVANPVLQLLVALNGPTANALISLLLGEENTETSSFSSRSSNDRQVTSFFTIMIKDRVGSHLVEKILSVASDEDLEKLFTRYFESRMMDLCLDPVANFVVAALVTRCAGKSSPSTNSGTSTYLGHIVKELRPHLARLLFNNRGGLVEKLVAACGCSFTASTTAADDNVRNELVDALWVALEVTPAQMAEYAASIDQQDATSPATTLPPPPPPVISCLVTNRESKYILASPPNYSRSISMHGCLIAQHLLTHYSYSHIEPLITSLRALSPDTLVTFLTHPALSRVIEAVYTASSVPFESKWAITTAVAGKFCLLAKDKYGCHFVDKCWAVADVKLKVKTKVAISCKLKRHCKYLSPYPILSLSLSLSLSTAIYCPRISRGTWIP